MSAAALIAMRAGSTSFWNASISSGMSRQELDAKIAKGQSLPDGEKYTYKTQIRADIDDKYGSMKTNKYIMAGIVVYVLLIIFLKYWFDKSHFVTSVFAWLASVFALYLIKQEFDLDAEAEDLKFIYKGVFGATYP